MKTKNEISIRERHDELGVEICVSDEFMELTLDEARVVLKQLQEAINNSSDLGPQGVPPLFLSGHKEDDPFAEGYRIDDHCEWAGTMGGHGLVEENIDEIMEWCQKIKKYIEENK